MNLSFRSKDPQEHPIIQPNYLTEQEDVDTMVAGLKEALKLLDTEAMKKVGTKMWKVKLKYAI